MKVCTDACLFGAWLANEMKGVIADEDQLLDIGTGTGLLSLMIAQKFTATIDAIEINTAAAEQAKENIAASPFHAQVQLVNASIQQFNSGKKYKLIFSNPPFFENDLASPDAAINAARHAEGLTLAELAIACKRLCADNGFVALLLPVTRLTDAVELMLTAQFHLYKRATVKHSAEKKAIREMLIFRNNENNNGERKEEEEICLYNNPGAYSKTFISLLKDYYLYL